MVSPLIPAGTLTVFPLTHSVASELDAIADPQPKVLKRASTILPFSSTSTCESTGSTSVAGSALPGTPESPSQGQAGPWGPPHPRDKPARAPGDISGGVVRRKGRAAPLRGRGRVWASQQPQAIPPTYPVPGVSGSPRSPAAS